MKVIVAGYPKTGTKSMNAALTELGYNVYDAIENFFLLREEYKKIFDEGWSTEDFRKMYENVDAVTDIPACFFWDEIHKAFPDAKIILTIRDDEDVWCRSLRVQLESQQRPHVRIPQLFSHTLARIANDVVTKSYITMLGFKAPSLWASRVEMNEQMAKKCYRSHNAYVMRTAPKDKLLIYKCSDGWQPLCEFLGHPIPATPFPHKNIKGNIVNEMDQHPIIKEINKEILRNFALGVVTAGVVTYCSFKYGPLVMARAGCIHLKSLFGKLSIY